MQVLKIFGYRLPTKKKAGLNGLLSIFYKKEWEAPDRPVPVLLAKNPLLLYLPVLDDYSIRSQKYKYDSSTLILNNNDIFIFHFMAFFAVEQIIFNTKKSIIRSDSPRGAFRCRSGKSG